MWMKAMVAVDGSPERKVHADFDGSTPHYAEWHEMVPFNAEVTVNAVAWYADTCKAASGLYHIKLMPERRFPVEEDVVVPADPAERTAKRKSK